MILSAISLRMQKQKQLEWLYVNSSISKLSIHRFENIQRILINDIWDEEKILCIVLKCLKYPIRIIQQTPTNKFSNVICLLILIAKHLLKIEYPFDYLCRIEHTQKMPSIFCTRWWLVFLFLAFFTFWTYALRIYFVYIFTIIINRFSVIALVFLFLITLTHWKQVYRYHHKYLNV